METQTIIILISLIIILLLLINPKIKKIEARIVNIQHGPEFDECINLENDTFLYADNVKLYEKNYGEFSIFLNKNILKNKKIGDKIEINILIFKSKIKIFNKYLEKKFIPFF